LKKKYDIVTCFEVLEHVTEPLKIVKHIVDHLKIGGTLFIDFIADEAGDENLAQSQAQRNDTIDLLNTNLKVIWALDKNCTKFNQINERQNYNLPACLSLPFKL
jgi:SAM-dependent methyltransferase